MLDATSLYRLKCKFIMTIIMNIWYLLYCLNNGIYWISEDLQKIMVKISKEFFVELNQDETLAYIVKKEKSLNNKIDALSDKAA